MSRLSKHGMCSLNGKRIQQARMTVSSTLFLISFKPWLPLGFAKFTFSVTLSCLIFFLTPPITFPMISPSVLRVKSRLLSPLLNRRPTAPVYRHFVKSTPPPPPPRGPHAIKSALNPGFGCVKSPLCPRTRGSGVSID